jgi:type II secretory pathway component PulM
MREQWRKLSERFGALQTRERVLVLLGVVVGTALVFDSVLFQPAESRKKTLEGRITEARQNLKVAETVMQMKEPVGDSQAIKRSYRDALRVRLAEVNKDMVGLQQGMVPAERMPKLLEDMLARTRGLQLISLPGRGQGRKDCVQGTRAHDFSARLRDHTARFLQRTARLPCAAREAAVANVLEPAQRPE